MLKKYFKAAIWGFAVFLSFPVSANEKAPLLSALGVWDKSIVDTFKSDSPELQFKIKELKPTTHILKYPINELIVDQSAPLFKGVFTSLASVYRAAWEPKSSIYVAEVGKLFYPYKILQRRTGQDPVTGKSYLLAIDQWDRLDRLRDLNYDKYQETFKVATTSGERIFQFGQGEDNFRYVLSNFAHNGSTTKDNPREVLDVTDVSLDAKECAYRQFETFSFWMRKDSMRAKVLRLMGADISWFAFKVLNLAQISKDKVRDSVFLDPSLKSKTSNRYLELENIAQVSENIVEHLNFGLRHTAHQKLKSTAEYEWEKETKQSISFNVAVIHEDAYLAIPNVERYLNVTLPSGARCVFNGERRLTEVYNLMATGLAGFTQYKELMNGL